MMTTERLTGDDLFDAASIPGVARYDLAEMFGLLWRRKVLLMVCSVAGAVAGYAIAVNMTPRYRAESDVVVRSETLTSPDPDRSVDNSVMNDAVVTTEQQVLTSAGLLQRVADSVVIPPALLAQPGLADRFWAAAERLAGWAGPSVAAGMHAFRESLSPTPPQSPALLAAKRLGFVNDAVTVAATRSSSLMSVQATTPDPQLSADIVNRLLAVYMQERSSTQDRATQLAEAALRARLQETRVQIAQGEDELVRLLQLPGAIEDNEIPGQAREMTLLGQQLNQAQTELARREAEFAAAVQAMHSVGPGGQPDSQSGNSVALRRELTDLQQDLAHTASDYGPNYPGRQALQKQVNTVRAQIDAESSRGLEQRRTDLIAARAGVAALLGQMVVKRATLQSQSATTIGLQRQRSAVASLWRISDTLETRLIDLEAHPSNPNARVLSEADVPLAPSGPSKGPIAIAGFVLAAVATVSALLIGGHRRRVRPLGVRIAQQLNVPLLGGLPQMIGMRSGQRRLLGSALGGESRDGLAETLHGVALELEDAVMEGKIGCLMVTSGYVGEGKTTAATALARALAAMSMRVLLVDLDLRDPTVESVFQLSAPAALEDGEQRIGPNNVLRIKRDRQSGLHIFTPFGRAVNDPVAQLRSAALRETLTLARAAYDLVLIDTPAVMAVPDALEVARHVDSIVLITELGRSRDPDAAELSRRLVRTRKPVCGVVVTKVEPGDARSGAYSGYLRHRPAARTARLGFGNAEPAMQGAES